MSFALIYWVIMLLWLLFGFWANWPISGTTARPFSGHLILFILLVLLGWRVFGAPVHQ